MPKRVSKLAAVAEPLSQWLDGGMLLIEAQAKLKAEHGIAVSVAWLSEWRKDRKRNEERKAFTDTCDTDIKRALESEQRFSLTICPTLQAIAKPLKVAAMNLAVAGMQDPKMMEQCLSIMQVLIKLQVSERAVCESFVRWSSERRYVEILESEFGNEEKVHRLHELMFGEPIRRNNVPVAIPTAPVTP